MVRRLVMDFSTLNIDGLAVIWGDFDGKFAEAEAFVKKTTKMMQVQVELIERKLENEIQNVKGEFSKNLEGKEAEFESKLNELDERTVNLESYVFKMGVENWLSKEEFDKFLEESRRKNQMEQWICPSQNARAAIILEAVTLEHVAKSVAYDRSGAPKDCRVFGWLQGEDTSGDETSHSDKRFLLTEFTYYLEKSNVQTYKVAQPAETVVVDTIRFCVTTTTYSIQLEGESYGFFKGGKGLRQGDPISPLLFVLIMEYLTRSFLFYASKIKFGYHPLCKSLNLISISFADDLIVACKAEEQSINCIMMALKHFKDTTGLSISPTKSEIIFGGVTKQLEDKILQATKMRKGVLPLRYLGGHVTSSRISEKDCERLLEKMTIKISSWMTKHLSCAGKAKLINSVLIQTKVRLSKFLPIDTLCLLCQNGDEDSQHLFCTCPYAKKIYMKVYSWCSYKFEDDNLEEMITKIQNITPMKKRKKINAIFAASSYCIWRSRNQKLHKNIVISTEEAFYWIKGHVSTFLRSRHKDVG
ncbi:unnamed protein product [Cuscuta campestris]|uniref:Reverse transcriptase domain-containing protein n=1 Tax=Cuscuta campestris TaxID=132261 RepID=A0A484NJB8_9ASTE|nr:unnamed protein product [Cuscuta campestris]